MRIDKFLTECGIGTRSEVKVMMKNGEIRVNGSIVKIPKEKIDIKKDIVTYNGEELLYKSERYYAMYKIAGYITAVEDKKHPTVMDLLPEWVNRKNLFPIGRLDKDTEGLLLFTTDGKVSHEMLSPKKHVDKVYFVRLEKHITKANIKMLEAGVDIGDYITKPAKVELINKNEIYLTISEGRFHQVKKMMVAVDNKVEYLKRTKFGKMELGYMKSGEVIEVELSEIY